MGGMRCVLCNEEKRILLEMVKNRIEEIRQLLCSVPDLLEELHQQEHIHESLSGTP